jgi:hypothetical protein
VNSAINIYFLFLIRLNKNNELILHTKIVQKQKTLSKS